MLSLRATLHVQDMLTWPYATSMGSLSSGPWDLTKLALRIINGLFDNDVQRFRNIEEERGEDKSTISTALQEGNYTSIKACLIKQLPPQVKVAGAVVHGATRNNSVAPGWNMHSLVNSHGGFCNALA